MTTGFDCQQFLEGLQKRNNERVALGKIKRREELATLEQIVVD
jgi:hypothetical protein